jgi:curved DNA-binding protein CbpA
VIRAAYHALMRRYHPDADPTEEGAERSRAINEAYAVLRDPAKRARYDESLGSRDLKFEPGAHSAPPRPLRSRLAPAVTSAPYGGKIPGYARPRFGLQRQPRRADRLRKYKPVVARSPAVAALSPVMEPGRRDKASGAPGYPRAIQGPPKRLRIAQLHDHRLPLSTEGDQRHNGGSQAAVGTLRPPAC